MSSAERVTGHTNHVSESCCKCFDSLIARKLMTGPRASNGHDRADDLGNGGRGAAGSFGEGSDGWSKGTSMCDSSVEYVWVGKWDGKSRSVGAEALT